MIICISGKMGTGKTTLATALQKRLDCCLIGISTYLNYKADLQGIRNPSREELQKVGDIEKAKGWDKFIDSLLNFSGWNGNTDLIIEGVRQPELVLKLRERYEVILVLLTVGVEIQKVRLEQRLVERNVQYVMNHITENTEVYLSSVSNIILNTELDSTNQLLEKVIQYLDLKSNAKHL